MSSDVRGVSQAVGKRGGAMALQPARVQSEVSLGGLDLDLSFWRRAPASAESDFRALDNQVTKGVWWMPRLQEATKDAGGCDKPRGAVNQAMIRGFLNGETHADESRRILFGGSEPGEVKHLSTLRKGNQPRLPE